MIIKQGNQYYVKSHEGKNLGGPYKDKKDAEIRLSQIEMFKAMERRKGKGYK